jgi:hypothetical protein
MDNPLCNPHWLEYVRHDGFQPCVLQCAPPTLASFCYLLLLRHVAWCMAAALKVDVRDTGCVALDGAVWTAAGGQLAGGAQRKPPLLSLELLVGRENRFGYSTALDAIIPKVCQLFDVSLAKVRSSSHE